MMKFRYWLSLAVVLFVVGMLWGLAMPFGSGGALSSETQSLQQLARFIAGLPPVLMFVLILVKNVTAVLFSFALSPLLLLFPVASLVVNGWLIGFVAKGVVAEHSLAYLLKGILPHGIIELPALFIGEAAALWFGTAAIMAVISSGKREVFGVTVKANLKYLAISSILFIPAALVETFITPRLIGA